MDELERLKRDAMKAVDKVADAPRNPEKQAPTDTQHITADQPRHGSIICPNPNCGYKGKPNKIARGSTIVGIILCFFFLLPGILYFMFKSGYRYSCPNCGMQTSVDN